MRIACIGEAMVELSPGEQAGTANIGFAGDTFNTAVYLQRSIQPPHSVSFVTRVGLDAFSDQMVDFVESQGVASNRIVRDKTKTIGLYAISVDDEGERSFAYWRSDSAARLMFQSENGSPEFSVISDFDIVYFSGITLAILPAKIVQDFLDWLSDFRGKGGQVVFDSNYRPKLWRDAQLARSMTELAWLRCDIGLPSIDDEMALFEDADETAAVQRLSKYRAPLMVVKRGVNGPLALKSGKVVETNTRFEQAPRIVDTTAAGDSFNGGFLGAWLSGAPLEDALLRGHETAMHVVAHKGAIVGT